MVRSLKVITVSLASLVVGSSSLTFAPPTSTVDRVNAWVPRKSFVASCSSPVEMKEPSKYSFGTGPAVLDRPTVEKETTKTPAKERQSTGYEQWEVRIYNDGMNTREHVARCLVRVTGLSEIAAFETMMQAHRNGMAVVGRWVFERAEMYYDALKTNGIICDLVPVEEDSK